MLTKREFLLTCCVIAISITGIWELGKAIPVVAAPPVSTAVTIADPTNNGNQASVDASGNISSNQGAAGASPWLVQGNAAVTGDAQSSSTTTVPNKSFNYVFNGATWDRQRGTANNGISVAPYGVNMVAVVASSGNVANATASATLAANATKTTYATGFQCDSGGATAAADVDITLTGALGGTMHFAFDGGALSTGGQMHVTFPIAVPGSAVNTALVISMPALGAGNTNATCNIEGYQL